MTIKSSPSGSMRVSGLLCLEGGVFFPHGLPLGIFLGDVLPVCYTGAVLVPCKFLLTFDVLLGELV